MRSVCQQQQVIVLSLPTSVRSVIKDGKLALDVRPLAGKDFQWDVSGIFTKNKNTVEELVAGLTRAISWRV